MTNEEKGVKLEQLVYDAGFMQAIASAESKLNLQEVFAQYGLAMSREEVDGFIQMMNYAASDELNEDVLDKVQGGAVATIFKYAWKAIKYIAPKAWRAGKKLANWEHSLYN